MKYLLLFFIPFVCLIAGLESCNFKVIPDSEDPCPDSLQVSFNVSGDTVTFNQELVFTGNHADLKYLWSFGDGESSTEKNPIHIYDGPGIYTVTLSVSTDFCTPIVKTDPVEIGVPKPTADFTPKNNKVILGNSVNFQSQTTGVVSSYKWLVNGAVMGSAATFSWTPPSPDTFDICLIACGPGGCSDTVCSELIVRPVTFSRSWDLDGNANTSEKTVGLAQLSNGGYGLVVANNNDPGCYIATTDESGSNPGTPGLTLLSLNHKITPANFIKIGSDYLLTGQAQNTMTGVIDAFLLKLNASFANSGFSKLQGDGTAGNTFGYGAAQSTNNSDFLILGSIATTGHNGMYFPTVTNNSNLPVNSRDYKLLGDPLAEGRYLLRAPSGTTYWVAGQHTNANGKKEAIFFNYTPGQTNITLLPLGEGWDVKKIVQLSSGSCLVFGYNNTTSEAQIALVDVANHTVTKQKAYPSMRFYDGLLAVDGRIILAGYSGTVGNSQAALFQLNPATMQVTPWLIPKTPGSILETALVMIQTADGGFALAGYTLGSTESKALLLKTDKNGVID